MEPEKCQDLSRLVKLCNDIARVSPSSEALQDWLQLAYLHSFGCFVRVIPDLSLYSPKIRRSLLGLHFLELKSTAALEHCRRQHRSNGEACFTMQQPMIAILW